MSLRHILGRDITYCKERLAEIEQRWAHSEPSVRCGDAQYRRDQVLADILESKIDIHVLASSFEKYEAIAAQHEELLCLFNDMIGDMAILRRALSAVLRAENVRLKKERGQAVDIKGT